MKIETKYGIGDEVWFYRKSPRQVVMSYIDHIVVEANDKDGIWYCLTNYESHGEDELFQTKEELLKSL